MRPATCGSGARSAKAAPPLKSTSTKASCPGGWVAARPATIVRNSSLLPDPVAPTTSPCGPIPRSAASLRSSTSASPAAVTPTGTRSSSERERARPPPSASIWRSTWSRRSSSRTGPARGAVEGGRSSRRGARRRARSSHEARSAVSVRMPLTRRPPGVVLQEGREALVVEADAHRELGRLAGGGPGQPDGRDTGGRGTFEEVRDARRRRMAGARARLGHVEDRDQVPASGGRVAGVGQPARPFPRRAGRGRVDHLDLEVVGGVEAASWQVGTARHAAGRRREAITWVAERNDHRGAGEPGGSADDLLRCFQQFGVVLQEGGRWGCRGRPGW